ncbi:hypothetical protein OROGR_030124 [Orobanche gracilis]
MTEIHSNRSKCLQLGCNGEDLMELLMGESGSCKLWILIQHSSASSTDRHDCKLDTTSYGLLLLCSGKPWSSSCRVLLF